MDNKTIYLALYNEIFINGQRDIGNDATVEIFDRNRVLSWYRLYHKKRT